MVSPDAQTPETLPEIVMLSAKRGEQRDEERHAMNISQRSILTPAMIVAA
jgi:hypothetical protein